MPFHGYEDSDYKNNLHFQNNLNNGADVEDIEEDPSEEYDTPPVGFPSRYW